LQHLLDTHSKTKTLSTERLVRCTKHFFSPPLSKLLPPPPLRVTAARPDPAALNAGACAGGCRDELGRQICLYNSRSRFRSSVCGPEDASVATWSRSPSSIGQARRSRVFVFLAVLLRGCGKGGDWRPASPIRSSSPFLRG
jgi:hypothetical protein